MNHQLATYYPGQVGRVLRVRNVNEALPQALRLLHDQGVHAESRGMKTIRLPGPFLTVYSNPLERVLFDPVRNANPFFHMIDALWLLSGSERVELPNAFLGRITDFSDDGKVFHGAYGHRLRHAYGFDQVELAVGELQQKPDTRQVVLAIWHPMLDLGAKTKDMPCNDMVMLDIVDAKLNMTVCNRSNDAIWGAYGANVVQFSMLQEYIAARVGVQVGVYCQMSNNFHVYEDNQYWKDYLDGIAHKHDPYYGEFAKPAPLALSEGEANMVYQDCRALAACAEDGRSFGSITFASPFFERTVRPMIAAHALWKEGHVMHALSHIDEVEASDWRIACMGWLERKL